MDNFKALRRLFYSKSKMLFFFFRFFIVMVCAGLALSSFEEITLTKRQEDLFERQYPLHSMMNGSAYNLFDWSSRYSEDGISYVKNSKEFLNKLNSRDDIKVFTSYGVENFGYSEKKDEVYDFVFINDNTFKFYDYKVSDGRAFSEEDYKQKDGVKIPVILGDGFKKQYSVGDDFSDDYQVVGFLERGSSRTVPVGTAVAGEQVRVESLDGSVLAPFDFKNLGASEYLQGFVKFEDEKAMDFVYDSFKEYGFESTNFVPVKAQFTDFYQDSYNLLLIYGVATFLVAMFAVVGMTSYLLTVVGENKDLFNEYFTGGGKRKDVCVFMALFVGAILTVSAVLSMAVFRSAFISLFLVLMVLVSTGVSLVLPIRRVLK